MINIFKKKKPNIIMILIDGARYDAIDKVPYYVELKKESVFFPKLITYAPYTIASLYALFSGIYGHINGVNGYYKIHSFDKQNCFTLTQYLKEKGYYTETDSPGEGVIPPQGFDKYRVHDEFKIDFLERHIEILQQIRYKNPFFLFLRYGGIHISMVKTIIKKYSDFDEEYFKNKDKNFKNYLKWVESSSNYLKAILDKIKELGLWENSIIFVFTDHGSSVGDKHGEKAYGVFLYDYTLRCFLYLIGKNFPKDLQINSTTRSIDILPTILEILKIKKKGNYKQIQGKSLLPFIKGKVDKRIAYSETGGLGGPVPSPEKHNIKSIRTDKWKFIYNETNKKKELYNLEQDKEEKNNLIGKEFEIEKYLWEKLQKQGKNNELIKHTSDIHGINS